MDGIHLANQLRLKQEGTAMPTLMFAVYNDKEEVSPGRMRLAGVPHYLVKPVAPESLQDNLIQHATRYRNALNERLIR